ncbi:uncharacterized protein LOC131042157 isoform X2 [Cryptomeria japonica]|uniref:uncharacterized protein LOC131042157 isoform X2 n=1 Tax=Cryptomeria japonica TaxID=3369 RepID=UPI0027DAA676|nr:uncharacterized protein LOC131042157 isoform X2 [Cryptomeria japonica]XP_057831472.2 uncharacterized protein LOC131042157 isoform X2 [Cryptomeria japonica]XP_057831473.2 uncharacterized protein LOC131042157 isoform X2 [Cryptomeria japonica]XP_057831474.2 uncharacterized protein LOC131042157 isoform X2 [Cryptomeria japonica]
MMDLSLHVQRQFYHSGMIIQILKICQDLQILQQFKDSIVGSHISETFSNEVCSTSSPSLNSNIPQSFTPSINTLDNLPRQSKSQPSRPGWFKSQLSSKQSSTFSRSIFSRHLHHACNNKHSGELSVTQIPELDSLDSSSQPASDGMRSSMVGESGCSSTMASRSVSDWWSMQTFSDLVASSKRDGFRWSDAESPPEIGWVTARESMEGDSLPVERIKVNNSQAAYTASHLEVNTCGICSHNLPYTSENMLHNLSVVAVLFCGHAYHAECLEQVTPEASKHDPSCPVCIESDDIVSERLAYPAEQVMRSKGGFLKAFRSKSQLSTKNKLSRRVANDDILVPEFFSGEILLSGNDQLSNDYFSKQSSSVLGKHSLNKRLFTRHFSLRGKSRKEHAPNDTACKLPITLRDSGESRKVSDFSLLHANKGSSSSFSYFKRRV